MHICIDGRSISHPRRGGFKTYIENLVVALADLPTDHHFTLFYDRPFSFPPIADNDRVHEVVIPARVPMAGQVYREQIALPRHRSPQPTTLWHFPYNTAPTFGIDNYVLTLHDVTAFTHAAKPDWARPIRAMKELALFYYPRVLIRRSARRAGAIITVSSYARDQIAQQLHVPPQKVFVTPLAAAPFYRPLSQLERAEVRRAVKKEYGLDNPFLLTVGSSLLKNPQGVLQAYASLPPDLRTEYRLVIVIAHQRIRSAIEELAQRLAVGQETQILTDVASQRLLWLYNLASLFVYPSYTESFGLPPLEAMACGTPVISSNVTSLPEVLGDAALQVDPGDSEALCEAIAGVLTSPVLAHRLRVEGLRHSDRFSWARTAEMTVSVYLRAAQAIYP